MSIRDAYLEKLDAQIEETSARLALARARAKQLVADGKIAAYEELADTEQKIAALREKLRTARAAGDEAWKDLQGGFDQAWSDLREAAARALRRFD